MQYESVIKMLAGMARDVVIGAAAGVVITLMEASPALEVAVMNRMLGSSIQRMQRQFERMGLDTTVAADIGRRGDSRKVWH